MKKLLTLVLTTFMMSLSGMAASDTLVGSTTPATEGTPEHVYTLYCGNGWYANAYTAPTTTDANKATFAFYPIAEKGTAAYAIYNVTAKKWVNYTAAASYSAQTGFVKFTDTRTTDGVWSVKAVTVSGSKYYQISPYTTSGTAASIYLNWYQGKGSNPLDGTTTLGLWTQGAADDAGSRWELDEIEQAVYTIVCDDDITVSINGSTYKNGDTYSCMGQLDKSAITSTSKEGQFATINIDGVSKSITVRYYTLPSLRTSQTYTKAVLYPQQQTAVGKAMSEVSDNIYTLYNDVLAATWMLADGCLYFVGSQALNLTAGSEPFIVGFGNGTEVSASNMTLQDIKVVSLQGDDKAVGGAEHYDGQALEAHYTYTYDGQAIAIVWRAVLRDGSHYLRTELELTGEGDVDMYDVIPLLYNVDTKAAGSTPQVIGNTRGAVLMSDKIFAGLENPVGYNTVGAATGDEDKWTLVSTTSQDLTATSWQQMKSTDVPSRVTEATSYGYPNIYAYSHSDVTLTTNQKVEVTVTYKSGNHRLNFGGCDLVDASGNVAANDYHSGYSGGEASNNTFTFTVPNDGTYTIRPIVENGSESIDATSTMTIKVYDPKDGVVINTDIVGIQGRWSRNTTLAKDETWKISGVVGLIAQDGQQANTDITKTQKRRSFLAYSERERAVPWRCNPAYISWYELNIDRNNAADPTNNMTAAQVLDVINHWKTDFYDKYGVGPASFVIDDGWDNYGTWTFHANFPNEMRDIAAAAKEMSAGVGAWLGPVGGYGTSGNYRRSYWTNKGQSMVLSNPNYYQTFLDAAKNLTQNQGDFRFFKFDGISAQFSATGPDAGDSGNENAEGIIRLERYVRENLKRDIFFNTTVGTWASPFWYHYTDATWRQENDYGTIGNNSIDRENWITYRDRLVYQNYVQNSPICPINTLMTHGFILSSHGAVSKNMTYAACQRELRCAFACGSGMVELYNDYPLMNSINNGALWKDLADLIKWQQARADILPDSHWVGGNPWDGSKANVYGWAAWNGQKGVLTLRNGATTSGKLTFTLREALEIPANENGSLIVTCPWIDQKALSGLTTGTAIGYDDVLTVTLPTSTVYMFDVINADDYTFVPVESIAFDQDTYEVEEKSSIVIRTTVLPLDASQPALSWKSSNTKVATVLSGIITGVGEGTCTITATTADGTNISRSVDVTVTPFVKDDYYVSFGKDAAASNTSRYINSVAITVDGTTQTAACNTTTKAPYQLMEDGFSVLPGSTVKPVINWTGSWMHGYVYCDRDQSRQFDVTDATDEELVSFTYYNGKNSAGTTKASSCGVTNLPTFKAPEAEGEYMLRFKVDWDCIDPAGNSDSSNLILSNGGSIVDVMLKVEIPEGITTITDKTKSTTIYDLQGRRIDHPTRGIYLVNGKKVLLKQ